MAFSRRLGVIGIWGASWLLAVGCSDDEDKVANSGNEAGEAGESGGGTPGSGGSNTNAGKGGMSSAGKGGSAGSGGSAAGEGGTPSEGGAAEGGAAGSPDIPVGGMSSAGAAGSDASGGDGGAGGSPLVALNSCAEQCQIDTDCLIDGAAVQKTCDPTSKRCVDASITTCTTADDCVPDASFWFTTCASSDECNVEFGEKCITWKGAGYCAYTPNPDCFPSDLPITLGEFGKPDSPVNVCYTPAVCGEGQCRFGCETTGCGAGTGDTCSPTTHVCECAAGEECASGVCGSDHLCAECVVDGDCPAGTTGLDKCVGGKCGCSGDAACPDVTANATPVCE